MNKDAIFTLAKAVIETEATAVGALLERIDDSFCRACEIMLDCKGRIVVIGMGKSGHIGGKIAATLASTGTPAFFVHPAEASHGDLGMIKKTDVVLALSNSGETDEVNLILPVLKRLGVIIIAMTGGKDSSLARHADIHLDVSVEEEACPLGLAPTSSTTVALVMGDVLARFRCWNQRVLPGRISHGPTLPANWAGACCCTSRTSCTRVKIFPA